jgi:S-disulfanyl-L-cysteine oxidoreductase SoxD
MKYIYLPVLVVFAPVMLGAQTPDSTRSTLSGVFSDGQASRGGEKYTSVCVGCHTTADHTQPAFVREWVGRMVAELFQYIRETMPEDNPNSMSAQEYADVTAYILKLNRMPAGTTDLPSDTAQLKIRIDTVPSSTGNDRTASKAHHRVFVRGAYPAGPHSPSHEGRTNGTTFTTPANDRTRDPRGSDVVRHRAGQGHPVGRQPATDSHPR